MCCFFFSLAGKAGVLTPVRKPPPQSSGDRKAGGEGVNQQAQEEGGKGRKEREDVTTPAAARARASLVNTSYVPEVVSHSLHEPFIHKYSSMYKHIAYIYDIRMTDTGYLFHSLHILEPFSVHLSPLLSI